MTRNLMERFVRKIQVLLYPYVPNQLSYKKGKEKDIVLIASRRSGSTHVAHIISCDRGVRYVDQPFDLFKPQTRAGKIKSFYLFSAPYSQFITLSDDQEILVQEYMTLMLNGKLKHLGKIEHWRFPFLANRTVLKICNASPLIDWFNSQFDVSIVYLVRHPIPQALSVMRNKWGLTSKAYIENEDFCSSYLDEDMIKISNKVTSNGTYFEKAIVNWCLENIVPLKHSKSEILKITYEELVYNPVPTINLLSEKLNLANIQGMRRAMRIPSQAALSEERTKAAIKQEKREYLISKWTTKVSDEHLRDARTILEAFGIFEYRVDKFIAIDELLH